MHTCLRTVAIFFLQQSCSSVLDLITASWGLRGVFFLTNSELLQTICKSCSFWRHDKCNVVQYKNPCVHMKSLSARFHPPPPGHRPTLHSGCGCGLQPCCITGGASCSLLIVCEGRERTVHLSLSLPHRVCAPTDTQTLDTVRSSSLQPPKKRNARTQRSREKDDRSNKNWAGLRLLRKLGTAQQVVWIFSPPSWA